MLSCHPRAHAHAAEGNDCWPDGAVEDNMQKQGQHLHEATQPEDGVVEAAVS